MKQAAQIKSFEQRVTDLEKKVGELEEQPTSKQPVDTTKAEFTMANFAEFRRDGDQLYSPPFHTHPNGYKM